MRSFRLDSKTKQEYGLFSKLSFTVVGSYEVANNPHIFITKVNQHIQEINRHFDGNLNNFGPMVFASNK